MQFSVSLCEESRRSARMAVVGHLDAEAVPVLDGFICQALSRRKRHLTLDLRDLATLDGAALSSLVRWAAHLEERGGRLTLAGAAGQPRRVLSLQPALELVQ